MSLKMFSSETLSVLKQNFEQNRSKYVHSHSWVEDFLSNNIIGINDPFVTVSSNLDMASINLECVKADAQDDLKNIKVFYEKLKELPIDLATDERFWTYLTHFTFNDYMKIRWGTEDGNLLERYFFTATKAEGDRALLRNGLSRLWWYGYITHDDKRSNKFELTEYLLQGIDFAQAFGERSYSRNPEVVKMILSILKDNLNFSPKGNNGRNAYRRLFKDINQAGGIKVLDFLDREDIESIIIKSLSNSEYKLTPIEVI
ncbi:hypothetical protein E2R56_19800 [Rhodococcus qingshengii]|nr:hypothetical protein E2R56_19800 [Rhodococcus qingshengii]